MSMHKKVILGVTGGIAAYKAADLARRLMESGLSVRVAMTANAEKFITALTFEALTGQKVLRAGLPEPGEEPMPHITYAREADIVVVAPATANIIGKLANGVADDALSTLLLACGPPIIMAPAMNTRMYRNPAVQENILKLAGRGVRFVGPASGRLACGDEGEGKMAEVAEIAAAVTETLNLSLDLAGVRMIVTAGGTREPVDPVRYIGNRSSGKMGAALAEAAALRGARVTLIAASMEIGPPEGPGAIRVETAEEMLREVDARFDGADVLIMAAAVGDWRAATPGKEKIKRKEGWTIELAPNPDILARMSARKRKQIVVGFAAETDNAVARGREKLIAKNLDMIVINDVSRADIGFGSDYNEVTMITRGGDAIAVPKGMKSQIADAILDHVASAISSREEGDAAQSAVV